MSEVTPDIEAAKELANKWREASGQEIMAAWFPSQPIDEKKCLLARAFNLNCSVFYDLAHDNDIDGIGRITKQGIGSYKYREGSGTVTFQLGCDATHFSEVTGLDLLDNYTVALPDEIGLVAYEFDNGSYSEYAIEPDEQA